jgi:hypothetical protein
MNGGVHVYGQKISVSYNRVDFCNVLEDICKKAGLCFMMPARYLEYSHPVTLKADSVSLTDLLHNIFAAQPVDFALFDKFIVIRPRNIKGRVVDQNGDPISGVTIRTRSRIAITGTTGEFILPGASCDSLIQILHPPDSLLIHVRGQTSINIIMKSGRDF